MGKTLQRTLIRALKLAMFLLTATVLLLLDVRSKAGRGTKGGGAGVPSVLLWTMMRSGSRMTQDLLTAQSCSFLTEEPLRPRFKEGLTASVSLLQDLFACRLSAHPDYMKEWLYGTHNNDPRVARLCQEFSSPSMCQNTAVVEVLCRASCLRIVRVVAVGLATALGFLQDHTSNMHIVHLVRDPRGMFSSRRDLQDGEHVMFYKGRKVTFFHNDEMDVSVLCHRYRHDLAVATHLARRYPDRYTLVRYEDMARLPHTEVRRLYAFIGLPYTPVVATAVSKQTMGFFSKESEGHPFSTSKNSSGIVFAWRSRLPFSEVERIQEECGDVLRAYGYRQFSRRQYEEERDSPLLPLPSEWAASQPEEEDGG